MSTTSEQIEELKSMLIKQGQRIIELSANIKAYRKSKLNVDEAAAFLGVSKKTIHNKVYLGHLSGYRIGGSRFFTIEELEDYVKENKS